MEWPFILLQFKKVIFIQFNFQRKKTLYLNENSLLIYSFSTYLNDYHLFACPYYSLGTCNVVDEVFILVSLKCSEFSWIELQRISIYIYAFLHSQKKVQMSLHNLNKIFLILYSMFQLLFFFYFFLLVMLRGRIPVVK